MPWQAVTRQRFLDFARFPRHPVWPRRFSYSHDWAPRPKIL